MSISEAEVIAPFLNSEVRSGLAGFFHGLEHSLAFLFGLLEPLPLLFDVTLFLFFNFPNPSFFFFLLLLSEALLFFSAGYLALSLLLFEAFQLFLLLGPLFAPFVDVFF
ncbi:hypothetical protein MZE11_19275 [Bacillus amyloliquefaciens]|nr:hypothetical protein [Bacillus amyloliquefaciens]